MMEQSVLSIISGGSTTAVVCALMYFILQNKFKLEADVFKKIDNLCDKLDKVITEMQKLQADNVASAKEATLAYNETKEHYAKIAYRFDALEQKVDDIILLSTRTFDKLGSNVRLGQILVQNGLITQEALDKALKEQSKYL